MCASRLCGAFVQKTSALTTLNSKPFFKYENTSRGVPNKNF
jgi:hypothetical protein